MLVVQVNAAPVKRALDRLSNAATRRLGAVVGAVLESKARDRITNTKRDPEGRDWRPWTPAYALAQERRNPSASLLDRTGALVDSIAHEVRGDLVIVGSPLAYAAVHQEGAERTRRPGQRGAREAGPRPAEQRSDEAARGGRRGGPGEQGQGPPARPFLGLGRADADELEEIIADYLEREASR